MNAQELLSPVLAGLALVLVAVAFGAVLMWRVVHLPSQPPALPVWVTSLLVAGGVIWIVAAVIAGQWLGVAGGVLISIGFGVHLIASLRRGPASGR